MFEDFTKKVHKQPSWQITDKNVYSVEMQIHADSSYNVSPVRALGCKIGIAEFNVPLDTV